ncbi:hypothetical protein AAFF_G00039100 [Aldrovandia affinis]|uniref:Uncharacterized protein n=1 Tax=Aldrovandia affinis TaxID=143900 RepID=A0AAD7T656_9TELE|nr:hypothetical protein AAFF_G00039100 [Aldrovandia affinis]
MLTAAVVAFRSGGVRRGSFGEWSVGSRDSLKSAGERRRGFPLPHTGGSMETGSGCPLAACLTEPISRRGEEETCRVELSS